MCNSIVSFSEIVSPFKSKFTIASGKVTPSTQGYKKQELKLKEKAMNVKKNKICFIVMKLLPFYDSSKEKV